MDIYSHVWGLAFIMGQYTVQHVLVEVSYIEFQQCVEKNMEHMEKNPPVVIYIYYILLRISRAEKSNSREILGGKMRVFVWCAFRSGWVCFSLYSLRRKFTQRS
jgi:hypothetical protein